MNPLVLSLAIVVAVNNPTYAHPPKQKSGFDRLLKSLFTPRTKEVAKPKRKTTKHVAPSKPETKPKSVKTVLVDPEWMARYWELEAAWDYAIPEDDQIKWKDGKYIVPIVVFKHYEDMSNTPRRVASPQSDARSVQPFSFSGYD